LDYDNPMLVWSKPTLDFENPMLVFVKPTLDFRQTNTPRERKS
jgi:hypothetical protein